MTQLKVLHIISSLDIGGAEVLLKDISRQKNKFVLHIIANKDGVLLKEIDQVSSHLTIIPKKGIQWDYIQKLREYIKKKNIKLVHLHDGTNAFNIFIATLFLDVKKVFTVHGSGKSLKKRVVLAICDNVLFVSETLREKLRKKTLAKHVVHYNGVDLFRFSLQSHQNPFPEIHKDCMMLMGMVGNFKNAARDQLNVCRALKILKDKGVSFRFVFVGEKSEHKPQFFDQCYDYCHQNNMLDQVFFVGGRTDIPSILAHLDIFIYSSHMETFCLSVVEAMMSGTAVITNDLPIFIEITDKGRYAEIYKSGDERELAMKMEKLMFDEHKRQELGKSARQWASENFSIEKHVSELHKIYQDLMHA